MSPIGWAIIGTGMFAERAIVPGLRQAAGAELRAICSRDLGRAREFAGRHDIPAAYGSLDDLFRDGSVQAVWITTPHGAHAEPAIRAAEAGRHILCEKPLATAVADARAMIDAADRRGVRLGTGFHLRHNPLIASARRRVRDGEIGEVVIARGEYSHGGSAFASPWRDQPELAGGGILTGTGVHMIDALRFVLGFEVEAVAGFVDDRPPERPVDEIAAGTLRFTNGACGLIAFTRWSPKAENPIEVQGKLGRLTVVGLTRPGRAELRIDGETVETANLEFLTPYIRQVEAFNRSIEANSTPSASGLDGLRATEIMIALQTSSRTARTVRLVG